MATQAIGGKKMAVGSAVIGTIIGFVALYVVVRHLGGHAVPFVSDDRTAFMVLGVVGIIMCAFGIQTVLNTTGLLSPAALIGAVLGIMVLISFVLAIAGQPMFLLSDYRSGFIALGIVMLVKWSVSTTSLAYTLTRG